MLILYNMDISKPQLEQFVRTLQQTENTYFNSSGSNTSSKNSIVNPKLDKLNNKKIKLLNKLKFDVMGLIALIDEIENETKNPSKVKVVGV
jgi:hypothetical protein